MFEPFAAKTVEALIEGFYPPSPSENGCLGCIIEGRTAITTPPKPL